MTTDVKLNNDKGYFDFEWTEDGDISMEQSLDTAILMSIFEEQRAEPSEIPQAESRRGWEGNESTPGFEIGSKVWQFEQERITGSILAELGVIVQNGLQWMVDDGIAVNVQVSQPFLRNGVPVVKIDFSRDGSEVDSMYYELWDNTGAGLNF